MDEKELYSYWKKYVDSKFLYRVVSEEYIPSIRKHGFNHNKDPFEKNKKDIYKLFSICMRLYKQGFIMMRWWGKPADQKKVIKTSKEDLANPWIDFTPDFENIISYYLNLQGGALVCTVRIFTEELIMKRPPLSDSEWRVVKKLNVWSTKKYSYRNKVVVIRASSKCFEHAHFQWFRGQYSDVPSWTNGRYVTSPFGSFDNFKKAVKGNRLKFYDPYISGKKLFHLRTKKSIAASEIEKITDKI